MQKKTAVSWLKILIGCLILSSCSKSWNDPTSSKYADDSKKIYYGSFSSYPKHLDPVRSYSANESIFLEQIYEPPLQYHFLKRPYVLEPYAAEKLPIVEFLDENLSSLPSDTTEKVAFSRVVISLRKDVRYQPHPAFVLEKNGKHTYFFDQLSQSDLYQKVQDFPKVSSRNATSDDFIYQIKRMADRANQSPIISVMSEYIVGMKEFTQWAQNARKHIKKRQWLDLRKHDISGVKKINDYQYSILLKGVYPQFKYWLALRFFSPVAWEVDRFYHNLGFYEKNMTLDWNPVGTGPFMLTENTPNRAMVLEKNPNFQTEFYPTEGMPEDEKRGYLKDAGKKIPFLDKVVFRYEVNVLPTWGKFLQGYYDRSGDLSSHLNNSTFDQAFSFGSDGLELTQVMKEKNITVDEEIRPSIYYIGFNMRDSVIGGYTEDKRKLRQAISIAYDTSEYIAIFLNGIGEEAQDIIPTGLYGSREGKAGVNPYVFDWDEKTKKPKRKSLAYAKKLLAEAGYPNGFNKKTGKPLTIYFDTTGKDNGSAADWRRKKFKQLGIQLEYRSTDYTRFQEKVRLGNVQMFGFGWIADYPDPENFLFLLNSDQITNKCHCDGMNAVNYDNPVFDSMYKKIKVLENGPERLALIHKMIRMIQNDSPWIWNFYGKDFYLSNVWLKNTKKHGITQGVFKYVNLDTKLRKEKQHEWNFPILWPLFAFLLFSLILVVPGVVAYRKRQKKTVS